MVNEKPAADAPQRAGLKRALYVALASALVAPGLLSGFALIEMNLRRTLQSDTQARAEKFADLLQAGMSQPMWDVLPESGRPLIDAVSADPSVVLIEISDDRHQKALEFHRDPADIEKAIFVSRSIMHGKESLGQVRLGYSTAAARTEAKRSSGMLLTIIVIQLTVSIVLIGSWLNRRVLRPLEVLRTSAEGIAGGDLRSAVPVQMADEFGMLSASLDVMRGALAQSLTQLEARVQARTRELTDLNLRLQTALDDLQRAQNRLVQSEKLASLGSLVAGVAHELNTPIGTGVTVTSTITDKCVELRRLLNTGLRRSELESILLDIEQASALAQTSLQRAARLVRDFKQVAVDQTSAQRREFTLHEVIREILVALKLRHKRAPITIVSDIPSGIEMNSYPGAVEQVISNLVDNAVLHGAAGRSDCQIVIAARRSDEDVVITVADNGNGIPSDHLSKIFDPFFTTQLGHGGSGLGLNIVYGLVTGRLGGQISVASAPDSGAKFTLTLPLQAPRAPSRRLALSGPDS